MRSSIRSSTGNRFGGLAGLAFAFVFACTVLCSVIPAVAATPSTLDDAAYAEVNAALVSGHVVPAYETLAATTRALDETTTSYCSGDPDTSMEALQQTFRETSDAWMGVEHVRFGPAELFMRNLRLNFWPQARGKVSDAIADALSSDEDLKTKPVSQRSFAVQGLPALEYLVFAAADDGLGLTANAPHCDMAQAISGNMRVLATDVLTEWTEGDTAFQQVMTQPGPKNTHYQTPSDVTLVLFRSLHDGLQRVSSLKLIPVLGKDIETARPGLGEAALSNRGVHNIRRNIAALESLYLGANEDGLTALTQANMQDTELDALMRKAFRKTRETADSISLSLPLAVKDTDERATLEKLSKQVRALRQIVAERLAPALGLSIGFNSLDGD
ncbi:MAG: imelysin family protein [Alphaproteobacteria bacterium]|nr:imelysin family protein [Alphaproteobacteria bacterium]